MIRMVSHRRIQMARQLAIAIGAVAALMHVPPAYATPVGECQVGAANQVEVTQCLRATLAAADHVMGAALERLLSRADELDGVTGRVVARPAVEQSQVAWQAFRETTCAVPAALTAGASGSGQFQLGCTITMARARATELNDLAAGIY